MKNGVRESSSRAYLHSIRNRHNFHIRKGSMVTKILIDPQTKTTEGVEFVSDGHKYVVRVSKEVIVSAGAINSPQLLMLSGVGPKKHLAEMGIPLLANLKVGYNLMDHISSGSLTFVIDKPYTLNFEQATSLQNLKQYFNHHTGPITAPNMCEVVVFYDLKNPTDLDGYPDIEIITFATSFVFFPVAYKSLGITDQLYDTIWKPIENGHSFVIMPMLLRPKSRGRIILRNKDYKSKPRIFPNYFAVQEDLDTLVAGVRLVLNITKQPALLKLGTKLHDIPLPQCARFHFGSDQYFECATRVLSLNFFHYSGTCKMGPRTDKRAVVDPRLKVYGIKGLRVIDASVMPEIPAAHTNSPTYMIAEKGADMIKEDWSFPVERN